MKAVGHYMLLIPFNFLISAYQRSWIEVSGYWLVGSWLLRLPHALPNTVDVSAFRSYGLFWLLLKPFNSYLFTFLLFFLSGALSYPLNCYLEVWKRVTGWNVVDLWRISHVWVGLSSASSCWVWVGLISGKVFDVDLDMSILSWVVIGSGERILGYRRVNTYQVDFSSNYLDQFSGRVDSISYQFQFASIGVIIGYG